jgi:hypothetical protein
MRSTGARVTISEVYVDESGSDDRSPVLCVSGYLFHAEQSVAFQADWQRLLAEYDLPYFHMVDCAPDPGIPHSIV